MDIWLFGIFLGLFGFFLALSAAREGSRIFGMFAGITLLFLFLALTATGIDVPYGQLEVISANQNQTQIYQNFTDVYDRTNITHTGLGLLLLGLSFFIMAANIFNFKLGGRA